MTGAEDDRARAMVVVPALNEMRNMPGLLAALAPLELPVVVVDSGSTDGTIEHCRDADVEVLTFDYDGGPTKKKAWALQQLRHRARWLLFIDADERPDAELVAAIRAVVDDPQEQVDGYAVNRQLVMLGRKLTCFSPNWNVRLVRADRAWMEDLGLHDLPGTGDNEIHEHFSVEGEMGYLPGLLFDVDENGMDAWIAKHNRYASWEAELRVRERASTPDVVELARQALLGAPLERKRALRKVWVRTPIKPLWRFLIWYVGRRGFRDGRAGFLYCQLMASYEVMIAAKEAELTRNRTAAAVLPPAAGRAR